MNSLDIGYFIKGLKVYLTNTRTTQEEFARGVTSTVNLSNLLRGNTGTSKKMRNALAKKAGMSIEELIKLGKQDDKSVVFPRPTSKTLTYEDVAAMSAADILGKVAEMNNQRGAANMEHAKQLNVIAIQNNAILEALTKQRDELIQMLASQQATLDAIDELVVVIDKDLKVIDCNRSAAEKLDLFPGSTVPVAPEKVGQVFIYAWKGETTLDGQKAWIYPILNHRGLVESVVLMVISDG